MACPGHGPTSRGPGWHAQAMEKRYGGQLRLVDHLPLGGGIQKNIHLQQKNNKNATLIVTAGRKPSMLDYPAIYCATRRHLGVWIPFWFGSFPSEEDVGHDVILIWNPKTSNLAKHRLWPKGAPSQGNARSHNGAAGAGGRPGAPCAEARGAAPGRARRHCASGGLPPDRGSGGGPLRGTLWGRPPWGEGRGARSRDPPLGSGGELIPRITLPASRRVACETLGHSRKSIVHWL